MDARYDQISPIPPLTKVTKILIIINVVCYFIDFTLYNLGFRPGDYTLNQIFGLVPSLVWNHHWYWQFFTYLFFHGHPFHLLFNMLILWYFGAELELKMGPKGFLKYFLLCGVGAGLFNFLVNLGFSDVSRLNTPIVGSSGAIYGMLAAYGIFFGNRYFLVFFLFPMKAKYYVLLLTAIELISGVQPSPTDNIAHFAHLGGMLVGAAYIYLTYIRGGLRPGRSSKDIERERLKRQFTLIVNEGEEKKGDKGPYWN